MENEIKDKPSIPIPVIPKESELSHSTLRSEFNLKLKDINYILLTVVVILLVMVATLVIDSFHINSAIYKEYSQKTESVETTQNTNEVLLKQIQDLVEQNKKNQEIIIEQQKQIQKFFNK